MPHKYTFNELLTMVNRTSSQAQLWLDESDDDFEGGFETEVAETIHRTFTLDCEDLDPIEL